MDPVQFVHNVCTNVVEKDIDVLVAAGDIVVPAAQSRTKIHDIFSHLSKAARHVLYVYGNHEYYGGSKEWVEAQIQEVLAEFPNIHTLDNSELEIEGRHFVGGSMWYPVGDGLNQIYEKLLNDCRQIMKFNWAERENAIFRNFAGTHIRPETIVVTHHMPSFVCVPNEYKGSNTNRFFVSDMADIITQREPKMWFYGHTHKPKKDMLANTLVLCNPYGYPGENKGGYAHVVFEI